MAVSIERPEPPVSSTPTATPGRPAADGRRRRRRAGAGAAPAALDNARWRCCSSSAAEVDVLRRPRLRVLRPARGRPVWPPPLQPRLPVGGDRANTLVLLASSVAMIVAGRALAPRRLARARPLAHGGRGPRRAVPRSCRATSGSGSSLRAHRVVRHLRGDVLHADRRPRRARAGRARLAAARPSAGRARRGSRRAAGPPVRGVRDLLALRGRRCGRSSTWRCTSL